jgi:hypothetical protein
MAMKSQAAESAHPIDAVPHQLDSVTLAGHLWSLQGLSPLRGHFRTLAQALVLLRDADGTTRMWL